MELGDHVRQSDEYIKKIGRSRLFLSHQTKYRKYCSRREKDAVEENKQCQNSNAPRGDILAKKAKIEVEARFHGKTRGQSHCSVWS